MHHLLYHARCADGFASACIALRALTRQGIDPSQIRLQPVNYPDALQLPPTGELYVDDHLYYLDYTPPQSIIDQLWSDWKGTVKLTIIDHHASAQPRHTDPWFTSVFDLGLSGALLTFNHFHPKDPVPDAIQLISWRDLGHAFQQPLHRFTAPAFNLHATLMRATPRTPEAWLPILLTHSTVLLGRDLAIGQKLRDFDQCLHAVSATNPLWLRFPDSILPLLNVRPTPPAQYHDAPFLCIPALTGLGSEIMSEALAAVLDFWSPSTAPFAASWYVDPDTGLLTYSLRSRKDGPNVALIAAAMAPGGGGHPCAAGFSTPTPIPIPFAE